MRITTVAALSALALLLGSVHADATIDVTLQMQLGNPSGATADPNNHSHYLIQRPVEAIDYNDFLGEPNWASWDLTAGDVGSSGRSPDFVTDTSLPSGFYEVTTTDYSGAGYDRGHMCPSADRTDDDADNEQVFLMSNIIPQAASNNSGVWGTFEGYCRSLAESGNELLIICGPSGYDGSLIQPSERVLIPEYTWKIVVVVPSGDGTALSRITSAARVISLKIPNSNSVSSAWQTYVTSARQIEADTGFTFFTALPSDVADALRNKVDGQAGVPPTVTGFSPASGAVNGSVVLTGGDFSSVSAVSFNGVQASFVVNSASQITAVVPLNAASGHISVTTPTGTAVSSNGFSVTNSIVDLAVIGTHFGNFSQRDTGDTYTIVVTNVGTISSTNPVSVTDVLPAGLTATAISGVGWTASLGTLTCTRPNPLLAGASYPPIMITVNVATNAPPTVTNSVSVSTTGDANGANNSTVDVTAVNPSVVSGTVVTLAAWDMSGLVGGANNFGPSPYAPITIATNVTAGGLARGMGVSVSGTGAAHGWGGVAFTNATEAAAIAVNKFVTFTLAAQTGSRMSLTSISKFDYRRSATGSPNGVLQYQVGAGSFADVTSLSYIVNGNSVGSFSPINLAGIPGLQNIGAGTNVTFRIVNYGGSSSAGTWYIYDVAGSTAPDFAIQGTISTATASDLAILMTHMGNFTQGDDGDTYVITVTNRGVTGSVGTVSIADQLPVGLTATSLNGAGWTTDLNTLTCRRSESLAPGMSYPPITLTVSVATNAAAVVTNVAIVSGGGDTNSANDMVNDATMVIALTPVQSWRLQWFGIRDNTGAAADGTIAASDGLPNLVKYALGLDPLIPAANPLEADITTGFLRLTCPRNSNATDVAFIFQATGNLETSWTTNGISMDQNTPTLLQAHYDTPVKTSSSGFMRLNIYRP